MACEMQTIRVELGERSYSIDIGAALLSRAHEILRGAWSHFPAAPHAVLITDHHVAPLFADPLAKQLATHGWRISTFVVPAGESSKALAAVGRLWEDLLACGADRHSVVLAVGGGVVGDLAGFVAATYTRGIPLIQVPTTLLAQVDSSVGGKVGINLPGSKNMVGAFWQPRYVLIDTETLRTLPEREYRAGLAEVVKYGVIMDEDLFAYLETHLDFIQRRDPEVMQHIVTRCCRLKADVVEIDEREETGRRAILNYGHTFGHALEALTGYDQLLHGEAVAMGMDAAARLAVALGRWDAACWQRQRRLLEALGLPQRWPQVDLPQVMQVMQHDKKSAQGALRLILPSRLGHVELVRDVEPSLIHRVMRECQDPSSASPAARS